MPIVQYLLLLERGARTLDLIPRGEHAYDLVTDAVRNKNTYEIVIKKQLQKKTKNKYKMRTLRQKHITCTYQADQ